MIKCSYPLKYKRFNEIIDNLNNLEEAVKPDQQEFQFLEYFLNNPALKELIDVKKKIKILFLNKIYILFTYRHLIIF